jgi:ribosome-binding protein aMBF1 (putative translation factor)
MKHGDYVSGRGQRDSDFRAAREILRPQHEFRRALIGARLAAGLTQAELAARLNTTQSAVARLESGETLPRVETLCRLAAVLRVRFEISPEAGLSVR